MCILEFFKEAYNKTKQVQRLMVLLFLSLLTPTAFALDGGMDPANLGKGDWIYIVGYATNHLGGNVPGVHDLPTLMAYEKSQGMQYVVVKAATGALDYFGTYNFPQFDSNLVYEAHAVGLKIFGYTRSDGKDIPGEVDMASKVYNLGADGFILDAESEWWSGYQGTNGPFRAMQLCSRIKAKWPTKFLAHAPLALVSDYPSFPYKEFGYYCDAVMPQDYWQDGVVGTEVQYSASNMVTRMDTEWRNWQNSLTGIWTNAIKPLAPVAQGWNSSSTNVVTSAQINEFYNVLKNDTNPATAGGYKSISFWRADLHNADVWSAIATNTIGDFDLAPTILAQPESRQTNVLGQTITFAVKASGAPLPEFQWQFNGSNISGATGSSYARTNAQAADAGVYSVIVSNSAGVVVSSNSQLAVNPPGQWPSLISQSPSQDLIAGQNVSLAVSAVSSLDLNYQWRFNGTNIFGGDSQILNLTGIQPGQAGSYDAVVYTAVGAVTSAPVNLTVNYSLSAIGGVGGTVSLDFIQFGYPSNSLAFATAVPQPGYSFIGWTGDPASGANPLQILMRSNRVVTANFVRNAAETIVDNTNALFSPDTNWTNGSSAGGRFGPDYRFVGTVVGDATASADYRTTLASGTYDVYVWYSTGSNRSTNSQWLILHEGMTNTVSINQQQSGGTWNLIAHNLNLAAGNGDGVILLNNTGESNKVVIADAVRYVNPALGAPPTIISQPKSINVGFGKTATLSATAAGTEPFGYQWYKSGASVNGATNNALVFPSIIVSNMGSYTVVVTNAYGIATSAAATITVSFPPYFIREPRSQSVKLGTEVTFTVSVGGDSPRYYQWLFNGTNLADGATKTSYSITNVQFADAGIYSVVVTNKGGMIISSNAVLTVLPLSPMHIDQIGRMNDGSIQMSFSGEPSQNYILQGSSNLIDWMTITNLTSGTGVFQFIDGGSSSNSTWFYRTRTAP